MPQPPSSTARGANRRSRLALRLIAIVALGTAALPSARAAADEYTTRDVDGWTVAASQDGTGCFLSRRYDTPGQTTLLLGLDKSGGNRLSVLNANWSIRPKDRLKLDFRLSRGSYSRHAAIGMVSEEKQGFVTSFEPKFPSYFAASPTLYIARGDVPVERLDLRGSGAAVAELRRCVALRRSAAPTDTDAKPQRERIPIDPFAPATRRKSGK